MSKETTPITTTQQPIKVGTKKYVAIAGNIGSGKSSLTRVLSDYFKWEAFYEQVDDNPYLADFYEDMHRWAFNLQIFFLSSRFKHQQLIEQLPYSVVQDRTIYEDAEIFARNLHDMGLMSSRDYKNYILKVVCLVFFLMRNEHGSMSGSLVSVAISSHTVCSDLFPTYLRLLFLHSIIPSN